MKRLFLFFFLSVIAFKAWAQLPNGTIAPDFTTTDINGNTHNLYSLLDAGKTVYIDVSATWCGPCWSYHNSGALEGMWDTYGPPGTDEAFVIMIEGDPATNVACIYGPSGCVGGTQGNWTAGTPYPIADDAGVADLYAISYYPTIYMVCPADKKVYEVGQLGTAALWQKRTQYCSPPPVTAAVENVKNVKCFGTFTGGINITPAGGVGPYTYAWSNGATSQDLNNIPAGVYTVTITAVGTNTQGVSDAIEVLEPAAALYVQLDDQTFFGCNGTTGSLTVSGQEGWNTDYVYIWNNGQTSTQILGLTPGNYTVTCTDAGGCSKVATFNMPTATYPVATAAPPPAITCAASSIQLNGTASSQGNEFTYQWYAANGGNITAGATTLTPTVNAAGSYTLQVTNTENNCSSFAQAIVTGNTTAPTANAGPIQAVSCSAPTAVLQGSGTTGSNITYLWTASEGGNITAGATTLTPTVNAAGNYTLVVTNTTNGCTQSSVTSVTGNNTIPTVSSANGAITCVSSAATLTTTTNAANPAFVWTGPNNYTSNVQSPVVTEVGAYSLVVTDNNTGCTNTASVSVFNNTVPPGATANGGNITCVVSSVILSANSTANNATYTWSGPNNYTSNTQNPTVSEVGTYSLVVVDPANGCTSTAVANVNLNNAPPVAVASVPSSLNCSVSSLQINGTASSQGNNFTYAWTTTNGNITEGANTLTPTVNAAGTYTLAISNAENGCTSSVSATVVQNTNVNAGIASSSNITCNGASNGAALVSATGGNGNYTYAWSNGATTASISSLAAGTYIVVTTDDENCTATASVVIAEPTVLAANATATAQSANGVNDGTASAAPSGGTAGFSYVWSNSGTTATITGLAPGAYTVSVTDANGCVAIQTVTVNAFDCALTALITGTNITCFGANNGTASVALTGAVQPVTYAWSNGGNTSAISNLSAGNYVVNVVDGNNCPATLNYTVAEPAALAANAVATGETATGANNGTASATPTGGSAPFTYAWNTGANTAQITGLMPGSYTVVVTDANGCTVSQTVTVSSFDCAVSAQPVTTNVSCFGGNNGAVSLLVNGGTAPLSYAWSNGANTSTISNLVAATYTVVITDANGCTASTSATVTQTSPITQVAVNVVNTVCANDPTGSVSVEYTGGVQPYTYAWSNGGNTSIISGLTAGTYSLVLTDANGCSVTSSSMVAANDNVPPTVSAANTTLALGANGQAMLTTNALSVVAADNCGVATVKLSETQFDCTDLGAQVVTVEVTDNAGLTAQTTAIVTVIDNIAPVLTCPNNIITCNPVVTFDDPIAQDNCLSSGGTWKVIAGLPSGSTFPIGVTIQGYSYTDASGNAAECYFTITNNPPIASAATLSNDVNNQGNGSVLAVVSGGTAGFTYVWTLNGQVVGTTGELTGLTQGVYQVVVTDANGCTSSATTEVTNTSGATEPTWLTGVQIMPNPTQGWTNIRFAEAISGDLDVILTDATGRLINRATFTNVETITLDYNNIPAGFYQIRFSNGTQTGVRKLAIQR